MLKLIVVHLYPVVIRVLQINLLYAIGTGLRFFFAAIVAVFYVHFVKMFHEGLKIGHSVSEMIVDITLGHIFRAVYQVQLGMFAGT